jgi:hypothetical protein
MRKNLHYDWHWFWDTGNGEMGNNGVHSIDDCQHVSGSRVLANRVMSFGCRYAFNDDGQTPNSHVALIDANPAPYVIEIRNLPTASGAADMDHVHGVREGIIVHCEGGFFAGGRGGGWIYDNDGNKVQQFPGDGGATHGANFIAAVNKGDPGGLHADIFSGHLTSAMVHMANISYRLGEKTPVTGIKQQIEGQAHGLHFLERYEKHLHQNGISLADSPSTCGPWLSLDEERGCFTGPFAGPADAFLKRPRYRPPFVFPESV